METGENNSNNVPIKKENSEKLCEPVSALVKVETDGPPPSPVFEAAYIETNNKTLRYKCPMCKKKFKTKEKVSQHVNSHIVVHSFYTNGDLKCKDCNCYFRSSSDLELHVETHKKIRGRPRKNSLGSDDDEVKPFICDICTKCFKLKQQLLTHNLVHLESKPFDCSICEKSFKLKHQLQNHLKVHNNIRPFICETCEKSFKFRQQLENHFKTHSDIRPFICALCGKAFKFKQQLQIHNRVHDDLRLYKCDFCSKSFKLKQQLQFHNKVHTDERPFKCYTCAKTFKFKQQLQTHFKVHNKTKNLSILMTQEEDLGSKININPSFSTYETDYCSLEKNVDVNGSMFEAADEMLSSIEAMESLCNILS